MDKHTAYCHGVYCYFTPFRKKPALASTKTVNANWNAGMLKELYKKATGNC